MVSLRSSEDSIAFSNATILGGSVSWSCSAVLLHSSSVFRILTIPVEKIFVRKHKNYEVIKHWIILKIYWQWNVPLMKLTVSWSAYPSMWGTLVKFPVAYLSTQQRDKNTSVAIDSSSIVGVNGPKVYIKQKYNNIEFSYGCGRWKVLLFFRLYYDTRKILCYNGHLGCSVNDVLRRSVVESLQKGFPVGPGESHDCGEFLSLVQSVLRALKCPRSQYRATHVDHSVEKACGPTSTIISRFLN